jgi:hypothetical protein
LLKRNSYIIKNIEGIKKLSKSGVDKLQSNPHIPPYYTPAKESGAV